MSARPARPEPADGVAANGRPRESVWSYPRPPVIRPEERAVEVSLAGERVAYSERARRVCETSGAPVVYVPPTDVATEMLRPASGRTVCEFKGVASYFDVVTGSDAIERAAYSYRRPTDGYAELAGWISFYPARLECRLGGEPVQPQPGGFYAGWITAEIIGPIKGGPGSQHW